MSLTSAYNNLGILSIKNHQGDTAAVQFVKAIQVNQNVPVVVRHNAMQLSELTNNKFAKLSLSDAHRRLLANAIGTSTVEGKHVKLPVGWLFALDVDVPPDDRSSAKYKGIDAPLGGMEIIAVGTGVVVSPGTVLTSRSVDMLQRGLLVAKGEAGNTAKSSSQAITCRVEGGNVGGPVINEQGVVCGIAAHGDGNGGGAMIHIEAVRKWLSENAGNVQVTERDSNLSLAQLQARARTATLPVIVWAFPAEHSLAHQINASERARGALYIRDEWCLQCKGSGFFDCPDCVKGVQSIPRQTLQGVGFDGTPIFRIVHDKVPCPSCRQAASFDCPACQNGRINLN